VKTPITPGEQGMCDTQTVCHPAILQRIECEYREMPGLNLTPEQGARLWAMPRSEVLDMLDRLVARGVLRRNGVGKYVQA
jgi:hypothetical protein